MSEKTINVSLTLEQVDFLRGILFESYSNEDIVDNFTNKEKQVCQQLENILADAEDALYFAHYKREKYLNGV